MRLEFINRVKEKDVLGKSILTSDGQVLLKAGVELTNSYINKLKELGVFYLYVEDERLDDVNIEDEKLLQLKQESIKSMLNIMNNLYVRNQRELRKSLVGIEDMVSYIVELGDVNKSLYDIQTYDNYTFIHSIDTCIMASFLGASAGYDKWQLKEIGIGASLHDVGKTRIPLEILNKKDRLTDEEFKEIKNHPLYGAEILKKNVVISDAVVKIAEQHHERVDGKGYPRGLIDKQITNYAKLVCICDVYDAVSNDRCYRKKFSPNDAYELILSGSGSNFDQNLVRNFKNTFAIYPLGCGVELSNKIKGYVVKQNKGFPDRPVIRVLCDENTGEAIPAYEFDLLKLPSIVITGLI